MKICFLARPSFDVYSSELYNRIKKKDSSAAGVFITTNDAETNKVRNLIKDTKDIQIYETAGYLKKHWDEFNIDLLNAYESKYECAPMWEYIYTDRFLINRDYNYSVKIAAGLFSFFEFVFTQTKPEFYYSECIATLQCFVAYIVGKKLGVRYLTQMCARGNLDSTFHYFVTTPFQYNCELDLNYRNVDYSDEELKRADLYLADFERKDSPPPSDEVSKNKAKDR